MNLQLSFTPIFFVLDFGRHRVLAAKHQDKYEISGMYIEKDTKGSLVYHANLNNQALIEYEDRYDITLDIKEVEKFLNKKIPVYPEEQCNAMFQTGYYIY